MQPPFPSQPENFLSLFTASLLQKPEALALPDPIVAQTALDAAKQLFDLSKTQEPLPFGLFPSLLLEGFHTEQIWEQLQLRNTPLLAYVSEKTKELRQLAKTLAEDEEEETLKEYEEDEETLREEEEEEEQDEEDDDEQMQEEEEDEEMQVDDEEAMLEDDGDENAEEEDEVEGDNNNLEDRFFSLDEMEKFTQQAEREEEDDQDDDETQLGSDDEEIDYFGDPDEQDEEEDEHAEITYKDFFDAPKRKFHDPSSSSNKKKQRSSVESEEEDEEEEEEVKHVDNTMDDNRRKNLFVATDDGNDDQQKSAEELRQERMAAKIAAMEDDAMAAKKWTMTGEAGSKARPLNSLLEEDLDFEHNSKPVPIITAEMTETLEQMIKRRIIDANFDSVVRKVDPDARPFLPSSRIYISDEKSKKSLAEIYEEDYVSTTTGTKKVDERDEAMQKQHEEIDGLMSELFGKLDALSNFHFTPKLPKMEFTIKSNLPAIAMEEAIPVAVADGTLLAPEEVYEKTQRRELDGKASTELTDAERKKLRTIKKKDKRKERSLKEKERKVVERMNPTHHTPSKQKALASLVGQSNVTFIDKDGVKKTAVKGKSNNAKDRLVGKTVLRDQDSKKVMDAVKFKL